VKPTPEQVRQALANHRRPGRTQAAQIRDALTHVQLSSETKLAVLAGTHGLTNNSVNVRAQLWHEPD